MADVSTPAPWQRVVMSAIRDNKTGKVWTVPAPGRHHHVIAAMAATGIEWPIGAEPRYTQGFALEDGSFATRWQARRHAIRTNQIQGTRWGSELYSEDLWPEAKDVTSGVHSQEKP